MEQGFNLFGDAGLNPWAEWAKGISAGLQGFPGGLGQLTNDGGQGLPGGIDRTGLPVNPYSAEPTNSNPTGSNQPAGGAGAVTGAAEGSAVPTPMGGYVNPTQTYTGHTGYTTRMADGIEHHTPTGGGTALAQAFLQPEEKIKARPDLQGTARESFQANQFDIAPQNPQAPPSNATADANAKARSLRAYDASRQRVGQENLNAQGGNTAGTSMGPASPKQYQGRS